MTKILSTLRKRTSDAGATMVEYGIMVALIAVVVMVVVGPLGDQIAALFQQVTDQITP